MKNLKENLRGLLEKENVLIEKGEADNLYDDMTIILESLIGKVATKELIENIFSAGLDYENNSFVYTMEWGTKLGYDIIVSAIESSRDYNERLSYIKDRLVELAHDCLDWIYNDILEAIEKTLNDHNIDYDEEDAYKLLDMIYANISVDVDVDAALNSDTNISLFINNSGFENTVDLLADGSTIEDLVVGQGYSMEELRKAVGGLKTTSVFLGSLAEEIVEIDLGSGENGFNFLTILVRMTLKELLELSECQYIYIKKDAVVGIVDPYNGDGGAFEIELERDMYLPIEGCMYSLEKDRNNQVFNIYTVQEIYGLVESCWKEVEFFSIKEGNSNYSKPIILNHDNIEKDVLIHTDTNQRVMYNGNDYEYHELIYIDALDKWAVKEMDICLDKTTIDEALNELDPFGYTVNEALNCPLLLVEAIGENDYDLEDLYDSREDAIRNMSVSL